METLGVLSHVACVKWSWMAPSPRWPGLLSWTARLILSGFEFEIPLAFPGNTSGNHWPERMCVVTFYFCISQMPSQAPVILNSFEDLS